MDAETLAVCYIDYKPNNVYIRFPCDWCGGSTDKQDFLAELTDLDGDKHILCDECAQADTDGIRHRMGHQIERHEWWAAELRRQAAAAYILRTPIPGRYCWSCKSTENLRTDGRTWGGFICGECWSDDYAARRLWDGSLDVPPPTTSRSDMDAETREIAHDFFDPFTCPRCHGRTAIVDLRKYLYLACHTDRLIWPDSTYGLFNLDPFTDGDLAGFDRTQELVNDYEALAGLPLP
jgi:hypothetical protein